VNIAGKGEEGRDETGKGIAQKTSARERIQQSWGGTQLFRGSKKKQTRVETGVTFRRHRGVTGTRVTELLLGTSRKKNGAGKDTKRGSSEKPNQPMFGPGLQSREGNGKLLCRTRPAPASYGGDSGQRRTARTAPGLLDDPAIAERPMDASSLPGETQKNQSQGHGNGGRKGKQRPQSKT